MVYPLRDMRIAVGADERNDLTDLVVAELQIAKLTRAAPKANSETLDLQSFVKATQADLRQAEASVWAAPRAGAGGGTASRHQTPPPLT